MAITKETRILMHYTLKDGEGNLLETTYGGEPFFFLCGVGLFVPALEKELMNLFDGDRKIIVISSEEGYGHKDEKLILKIPRGQLPEGDIQIGYKLMRKSESGESEIYRVTGFLDDWVFLDANHPLAGKELHYEVEILHVEYTRAINLAYFNKQQTGKQKES
ncbi:MAG: hypothetical protein DRH24_04960 [Deltaproteobacteria bacterium]|nr:MAG: hypothetical protein DRH24_04960 [Deltaproteobacteria bacterium]